MESGDEVCPPLHLRRLVLMQKFRHFSCLARGRWPMIALTGAVVGAATVGFLRLQAEIRAQLPGILQARLEAALHRKVEIGTLHLTPLGISVDGVRVFRGASDREDPLVAKRLNVGVDWWTLATERRWQVSGVEAIDARVRLTQGATQATDKPWTQQLLALSDSGIGRFRVHNASLGLLPASGPSTWTAAGVTGELVLGSRQFHYDAQLKQLQTHEVQLASMHLVGTGDRDGVTLKEASAKYQGARVRAKGQLKAVRNEAAVTLQVDHLPLGRLATRLGIPADWAMHGSLTGEVTVDARDNALRTVRGNVDITRGSLIRSGGELPWNSAHARVDWTPALARLSDVKVLGNGVTLTANGEVALHPGQPFTAGEFQVAGNLSASDPHSVTQVADLLAFRQLLEGRWKAGSAVVRFQSRGVVDRLAQATSSGHIHVEGLNFQPVAGSETVTVQHLDADLERTGERLAFSEVKAKTDGMTVAGEAQLTNEKQGKPAEFLASGAVEVADLSSLRKAVPEASLWKWVPELSPTANGRLQFRLGGPVGSPSDLWSDGHFEVRDFRVGAHAPLPNGGVLSVPVQVASGDFRHAHRRLEVENLALSAQAFQSNGELSIDFTTDQPKLVTDLRVQAANWRDLPALPPNALPQLSNASFEGGLHITGSLKELAKSDVTGHFQLRDATYTAAREGAEPVPVRELAAQFRWAGGATAAERTLELPEIRLDSALLQAKATGTAVPLDGEYTLALDVDAQSSNAGQLAEQFAAPLRLAGGAASAQVKVNAPLRHLETATLAGSVALTDAEILKPVEPLGLASVELKSLKAAFSGQGPQWQVRELTLDAPGLQASATGQLYGSTVNADVHLKADRWNAPKSLPLSGGEVELAGKLSGDTARPEALDFAGDVQLHGAHAAYRTAKLSLTGGTINATLHGEGAVSTPAQWMRSGEVVASGAQWSGAGVSSLKIERASTRFTQDAGQFQFTDTVLNAGDAHVAAVGQWSPQGHSAEITASARDLSTFGITLPEALRTGDFQLTGSLRGSAAKPVEAATGRLLLHEVRLTGAKLPAQSLTNVSSQFRFDGERVELNSLTGSGPAGTITGHGMWSRSGHQLSLVIAGSDVSRLGVALPEGIHIGGYRLQADMSGSGKQLVTAATGNLRLTDTRFNFGPVAPHHLDRIETALRLDGKRVLLSDFTAEGATGAFTGSGEIADHGFRLALTSPRTNPDLVRWLMPGELEGGSLAGTLVLAGNSSGQLQTAAGHFEFKDGAYSAPETMGLLGGSFPVARLGADYRWERHGEKGRTSLTGIAIDTALGTGTGSLAAADGVGTLTADLISGDTGRVADRWPVLYAHLRGGTGTGKLQVQFDGTGTRGTLAVNARGGTLLLPGEVPEYAQQPVTTMSGILDFAPGKLTFKDVRVRGPKANLDGSGVWIDGGEVSGAGKAWFSKSYTSKLIKPSGFGWLAKLFGLKEIKSDFTLSGTSEQVKLNASITRGLLWKIAKNQVPKEFQKIATGKSPLWVKPLVVAEAQPVVAGEKLAPGQTEDSGD